MKKAKVLKLALPLLSVTLLSGCWRIGPDKVALDRFGYTTAVGDSWKQQMLLNLVKLRYGDVPVFLDVQAMISQYSLMGQVTLGQTATTLTSPVTTALTALNPWTMVSSLSGNTQYTDRPTITYAPLTGSKFGRSLMTPVPVASVLSMLQSGYPAKMMLRMAVTSINNLQNVFAFQAKAVPPDERYFRVLDIIAELQRGSGISIQVKSIPQSKDSQVSLKLNPDQNPDLAGITDELRQLLDLDDTVTEYPVVYGVSPSKKNEIAIMTRSMLDVLTNLSGYIEIPAEDAKERRAFASQQASQVAGHPLPPLLRVHSNSTREEIFVAIDYHGRKFWIDDRDIDTKMTFSSLMFLFTLVESDEKSAGPAVTIPTN
jgi:hypothetical protein